MTSVLTTNDQDLRLTHSLPKALVTVPLTEQAAAANTQVATDAGRRRRILLVANVPWFFALHRLPLALAARDSGFEVQVACGVGEGADQIRQAGLTYHQLALTRSGRNPVGEARTIGELTRLYRRLRPDIVHHVTIKPILYGTLAARIARVPAVVNTFAGLGYVFSRHGVWAAARRGALTSALRLTLRHRRAAAVFENADDERLLRAAGVLPSAGSHVVPGGGVDPARFVPTVEPTGKVRVMLASRMNREKGIEQFVAAAELLRARGVDADFVLVGDIDPGNPGSLSRSQLQEWDARGIVHWLGFRDDVPRLLSECHIACLPSYYREGVPRALMEAAACGRPIVATDMPGCRDICIPGTSGILVPPRDPPALAVALKRLIDDPELRRSLGAGGRQLVETRFSLPLVMKQTVEIYRDLI